MQILSTDVLVIGSGAAGLRAAIAAAHNNATVIILSKADTANNTEWADSNFEITGGGGCGLAAPIRPPDSPEAFYLDLAKVAGGRNIPELTQLFSQRAAAVITHLQDKGVHFHTEANGGLKTVAEIWHTHPRIVYSKDKTGHEIRRVLKQEALAAGVTFLDCHQATRLLTNEGAACGCLAVENAEKNISIISKATILATGGAGGLFPQSSNHHQITGDGLFLAADIGADLINMDLYADIPVGVNPLKGPGFVPHLLLAGKDLDVQKILGSRTFNWQLDHARLSPDTLALLYPITVNKLRAHAFDWQTDSMEFRWVAHFMLGGLKINSQSATNIPGLYAAGEVAGGITGRGRLPGTGIMEGLVFGEIAGNNAAGYAQTKTISFTKKMLRDKLHSPSANLDKNQLAKLSQIQQSIARLIEVTFYNKKSKIINDAGDETFNEYENLTTSILGCLYTNLTPAPEQTLFISKLMNTMRFYRLFKQAISEIS